MAETPLPVKSPVVVVVVMLIGQSVNSGTSRAQSTHIGDGLLRSSVSRTIRWFHSRSLFFFSPRVLSLK